MAESQQHEELFGADMDTRSVHSMAESQVISEWDVEPSSVPDQSDVVATMTLKECTNLLEFKPVMSAAMKDMFTKYGSVLNYLRATYDSVELKKVFVEGLMKLIPFDPAVDYVVSHKQFPKISDAEQGVSPSQAAVVCAVLVGLAMPNPVWGWPGCLARPHHNCMLGSFWVGSV